VPEVDCELSERARGNLIRDESINGARKPQLAQTALDRQLPTAREAQQALGVRVPDRFPRPVRKRFGIVDPPQEHVRIEENARQA
jgi:hypothetical protein